MSYIKIKVDEAKAEEIRDFYEAPCADNPKNPYLLFESTTADGVQVTGYRSKNLFTIVFNGEKSAALNEALIFVDDPEVVSDQPKPAPAAPPGRGWEDSGFQIGSDEVGVGDLFGPIVVAAVYLRPQDVALIDELGVCDSKRTTDSRILAIAPQLEKAVLSSLVLASPVKVSALHQQNWSMHKIMANLHNVAHRELLGRIRNKAHLTVYVDQFEREELYYKYLVNPRPSGDLTMHFQTKGESYYPSVAAASILARYYFLKKWQEMEAELGVEIPKGAGLEVDRLLLRLKNRKLELSRYVKTFFRNYQDLEDL